MQSWLCPTDRQLRLRACIARGWSTPRAAVAALTPAECAAVGDVLRRDRALRLLDWGRVGRVTDMVERLRLAQCGDGHISCRLCGRQLRHRWWRPSGRCGDCGWRFCDRCAGPLLGALSDIWAGRDCSNPQSKKQQQHKQNHHAVWLCKLCRESRLLTAKSGAWFHGTCEPPNPPLVGDLQVATNREPPHSPTGEVTSSSESSERHPIRSTNRQPSTSVGKSLSYRDLRSHLGPPDQERHHHGNNNSKLHRSRNLAIIRRRKSASCSQIGQLQCEYFPTELSDE